MATWPTVTNDDGSGTTGTIFDQTFTNSVRDYVGAAWTSVAFSAGNFTASTGSWTLTSPDQTTLAYVECGKTMTVAFDLRNTTVSATPSSLRITIPNGRTAQKQMGGAFAYSDNGTNGTGLWIVSASGTTIQLFKSFTGSWAAATDNTAVVGTVTFEID